MYARALFLFLFLPFWTQAQDSEKEAPALDHVQQKINAVEEDLKRLSDRLNELRSDSKRISDEIGVLELRRALLEGKIRKHELTLENAETQIKANLTIQDDLKEKAAAQKVLLFTRLRELYKQGGLNYAKILLKQDRLSEIINAYHYAKVLSERDHEALATYNTTIVQLDAVTKALEKIRNDAQATRAELATEHDELNALVDKRNKRLESIRAQHGESRRLAADLALEREELEMMVLRLANDDQDPRKYRLPITKYKGRLNWPVDGKVKRGFGVFRDEQFGTKHEQKGIDITAAKGTPVKSVYSGRVIFADWFKSYGNLVIIDHGNRITSFYAHNQELKVKQGDYVERDQEIALSGDTGSLEGPFLHLEIRQKAVPENPRTWLESKSRRRR